MKRASIAVLITCHNRRDRTLESLRCLHAQNLPSGVDFKVYLVDDGCTDGTGDAVREQYQNVHILRGSGNLYWCGGMRLAWDVAEKGNHDFYLWLNDDTMLQPGALNTLLVSSNRVYRKDGRDGIIVGSCRDPQTGRHTYGGRVKRSRYSWPPDYPRPPSEQMLLCDTMNGNLVLVPRKVFNQLGTLSANFTHAFGDTDYGMRARECGLSVLVAPGHLAECAANERVPPWTDFNVPLIERWRDMNGPKGLPVEQWYLYVKRHAGVTWPIYFFKPIVRVIFPKLWKIIHS